VRASRFSPRACSGDIKAMVPTTSPRLVSDEAKVAVSRGRSRLPYRTPA
jgi:hypothetical protein